MDIEANILIVNGTRYVPESQINNAPVLNSENYVIVRTYSAGVHAGYLSKREGKEVELNNARRVWYWSGAASLSQLATEGSSKPNECKISVVVPLIILTEAIEIIPVTQKSFKFLTETKEWKA